MRPDEIVRRIAEVGLWCLSVFWIALIVGNDIHMGWYTNVFTLVLVAAVGFLEGRRVRAKRPPPSGESS